MWYFVGFTVFVCVLGRYVERYHDQGAKQKEKWCMIAIYITCILFAGLRTRYNDTYNYIDNFTVARRYFHWSFDEFIHTSFWGFETLQTVVKVYFNNNVQWLLMLCSLITNIAFIRFYRKYSRTIALTLFCFIIMQPFLLTCAALKQAIAMSITLFGVYRLLEKDDKKSFFLTIIIAYAFHPYIIVMSLIPFLVDEKVWGKKMCIIVGVAFVVSVLLSQLMGLLLALTEGMNKTYSAQELLDHTINPIRVIVEGFPIFLTFKFRNEINEKGDRVMLLGINLMIISFLFTFASLFGNPIYLSRMGNYFGFMNAIVIPWMLKECLPSHRAHRIFIIAFYSFYAVFCLFDMCGFDMSIDPFRHTSVLTLFEGWFW